MSKVEFQTYGDWIKEQRSFASFDDDSRYHWLVVPFTHCPNIATLLGESNQEALKAALDESDPSGETYELQRFAHWATPYERFIVAPNSNAHRVAVECICALADYPVLDESDYSQRVHDATLENIASELNRFVDMASDELAETAAKVFGWLWEHNQSELESVDDQGGYPSSEGVKEALVELGIKIEAEGSEDEP